MKKSSVESHLREVEAHYVEMLEKVRALIEDVGGIVHSRQHEPPKDSPVGLETKRVTGKEMIAKMFPGLDKPRTVEFKALTKGDACVEILQANPERDYKTLNLFNEMKRRGHPVSTRESLASMLSTDPRFTLSDLGAWILAEPDLSVVNGHEKGAAT